VLAYLLDTSCLIAAQTPGERYHEASDQLVDAGRAGRVNLLAANSVDYDLEAAPFELVQVRLNWLDERPFIGRVGGPIILDVSRYSGGDIYVSDAQGEVLRKLQQVVGTDPPNQEPGDDWRRRQIDRHHASAALLARADALVTTDKRDLLDKAQAIWEACGLRVLDPIEALAQLDG
jgi:hypothetical protein